MFFVANADTNGKKDDCDGHGDDGREGILLDKVIDYGRNRNTDDHCIVVYIVQRFFQFHFLGKFFTVVDHAFQGRVGPRVQSQFDRLRQCFVVDFNDIFQLFVIDEPRESRIRSAISLDFAPVKKLVK